MKKYIILAAVCWFAVISLVGVILTVYDKRIAGSGKSRAYGSRLARRGRADVPDDEKNPPQDQA